MQSLGRQGGRGRAVMPRGLCISAAPAGDRGGFQEEVAKRLLLPAPPPPQRPHTGAYHTPPSLASGWSLTWDPSLRLLVCPSHPQLSHLRLCEPLVPTFIPGSVDPLGFTTGADPVPKDRRAGELIDSQGECRWAGLFRTLASPPLAQKHLGRSPGHGQRMWGLVPRSPRQPEQVCRQ